MSDKRGQWKSISQRVANRASERRLARDDAFTAYAMDRLLFRLGKSSQAGEFFLKGGVLVAALVHAPHRFTRDIDVLRRHGPADPDDIRSRFREVVAVAVDDGIEFDPAAVRAVAASHDEDGYSGVKVFVRAVIGGHIVDIRVDIGFGDAIVPPASRIALDPFLAGDEAARVFAYEPGSVLAEKIEAILSKFPVIQHRLKDVLDVVVMADTLAFDGQKLLTSLRATLERRETAADAKVLDDMRSTIGGRRWQTDWATMTRETAVDEPIDLAQAVVKFETFVRPLVDALNGASSPGRWRAGGPWA